MGKKLRHACAALISHMRLSKSEVAYAPERPGESSSVFKKNAGAVEKREDPAATQRVCPHGPAVLAFWRPTDAAWLAIGRVAEREG